MVTTKIGALITSRASSSAASRAGRKCVQTTTSGLKFRIRRTVDIVLIRSNISTGFFSLKGGSLASYPQPTSQGTASTSLK